MKAYVMDKQDRVISAFSRIAKYNEGGNPMAIDPHIKKEVLKTVKPRISFYNPENPLNGFKAKPKAEQKRILASLKSK